MSEKKIRNRHRIRKKNGRELVEKLNETFSEQFDIDYSNIDSATIDGLEIYIID